MPVKCIIKYFYRQPKRATKTSQQAAAICNQVKEVGCVNNHDTLIGPHQDHTYDLPVSRVSLAEKLKAEEGRVEQL